MLQLLIIIQVNAVASDDFSKLQKGSTLILERNNRIARKNGNNFSRKNLSNKALGSDSKLPEGAKLRYTGDYTQLKHGYGIKVELLSGVPQKYQGRYVWIYYKNKERSIVVSNEKAKTTNIDPADVTDVADLIQADESPGDYFELKANQAAAARSKAINQDTATIAKAIDEANSSKLSNQEILCLNDACQDENANSFIARPAISKSLNQELSLAVPSREVQDNILASEIPTIPLQRALEFYNNHKNINKLNSKYLIVTDLTQSSSAKRFYKINLHTGKVEKYTTSHGRGYSNSRDCANTFGNSNNSKLSSGGGYITGSAYSGKNGKSLHLYGMEPGKNDNAYSRSVVLHTGKYINDESAGRTWGCLTIAPQYWSKMIDTIAGHGDSATSPANGGTAIYVYPDREDIKANTYWDSYCSSKLKSKGKDPRWVN